MDVFTTLALAAAGALVLGVIGFFLTLGARARIADLETAVAALRKQLKATAATQPIATIADLPADAVLEPEPAPEPVPEPATELEPALRSEPSPPPEPPRRKAPHRSLEEMLGTRWAVWVGGLALALGALFLVRYSIEQGLFGPAQRIVLGMILAAALIGVGEWARRRDRSPATAGPSPFVVASVPGILTAVGTLAAFGTIFAAHALYGFIGPTVAFLLLGAVGIGCMIAAALHGPALAGLGLIGALATPVLVSSQAPNPWPVVAYIAVVAAAAYGLARLRGWLWLALATVAGTVLWDLLLAAQSGAEFFQATLTHLCLQTALAALVFAMLPHRDAPDGLRAPDPIGTGVLCGLALVSAATLAYGAGLFGPAWIAGAIVLLALFTLSGVGIAAVAGAVAAAGLLLLAILRLWPSTRASDPFGAGADLVTSWPDPVEATGFSLFAGTAMLAIAVPAFWRLQRSAAALTPATAGLYLGAATLTPLGALIVAYLRLTPADASATFAALAAALAAAFTVAAGRFQADDGQPVRTLALGCFAAAAIAALALGCVFALSDGTLTVALALTAAGTAYVAVRLDLAALRWCVAALGGIVLARMAYDPRIVGAALGPTPIFNWLLFGYGVPALAFLYAAHLLRGRGRDDLPVRVADGLTVLFAALLLFFEIRHATNGGDPFAEGSGMIEQGLLCMSSFGIGLVTMRLDIARANIVFRMASLAATGIGFLMALIGLGVLENPLFTGDAIEGGAIGNGLLLAYLLPALLAVLLARTARTSRPVWCWGGAWLVALLLLFAYLTLEVRRLFQGPTISLWLDTGDAEWWTYSAVWLLLGLALLAGGIWRKSREARFASIGLVLLTVVKVFLFDLSHLDGGLRALSFIGLGLTLIGVGLAYQKLVFGPRAT